MGVELQPRFQPALAGVVYQAEGKALVADLEVLETLAAERGLTPLSAFMDPRAPAEDFEPGDDFDGDPETYVDLACGPWTDWFSSNAGLTAIRALLDATRTEAVQDRLSDAETVVHDLEELVRCLEIAAHRKVRFRLEVG